MHCENRQFLKKEIVIGLNKEKQQFVVRINADIKDGTMPKHSSRPFFPKSTQSVIKESPRGDRYPEYPLDGLYSNIATNSASREINVRVRDGKI